MGKKFLDLRELGELARTSSYNDTVKIRFATEARRFLREVSRLLNDGKVSYNPGGIAVSGDATLRCANLNVMAQISDSAVGPCMYRSEKGGNAVKFSDMGSNQWMQRGSPEDLAEALRRVLGGA